MTQTPASDEPTFPFDARSLDEIGVEFGCEREPGEDDDGFAERITACLDEMIGEMQVTQDRVQELVS